MAGVKQRGIQSVQNKRCYQGQEVKPVRFVYSGGRSIMTGVVIETDELVVDEKGRPVPWKAIG